MIDAAIEVGIPKPITKPKLIAKLIAANSLRLIVPLKYCGTIGRNPSLNTAMPLFAMIEANAPIAARIM